MHGLRNTVAASTIPGLRLESRWRTLGASLLLSLALHLAVVLPLWLQRQPLRAGDPPPTSILARLVAPEPPAPAPAHAREGTGHGSDPGLSNRTQKERGAVAQPVHRNSPSAKPMEPGPAPALRVPYVTTQAAYLDMPDEVHAERLRPAQLRVPRSISLTRPAKPSGPIRIAYPPAPLARGEKAHVVFEIFVSSGGRVDQLVVLEQAGHEDFAKAASEGLRRARFRPAEGPEGKVRSRVTLRVDFSYE